MSSALITHWRFLWLVLASFIAGGMNAMAGGGSFISFPAMLGVGVAPIEANATNTVALWPGQLTSVAALRGDLRRDLLPLIIGTSILGGIAGAEVLLHTPQVTFLHLIPWLLALFGMEHMHELNALKVVAACASNLCAVITFIISGRILWHYCLVSMVAAALGGFIGAQYAKRMNGDVLRAVVVVTGIVIAAYFFYRQ